MAAERVEEITRWPVLSLLADPSVETDTLMTTLDSIAHQLQAARHAQGVRQGFRSGWWKGFTVATTLAVVGALTGGVAAWDWMRW